jgi:hypothetical protein
MFLDNVKTMGLIYVAPVRGRFVWILGLGSGAIIALPVKLVADLFSYPSFRRTECGRLSTEW